jgi:hypothetical protein
MIAALGLAVITPEQTKTIAVVIVMVAAFAAAVLYPVTRAWARRLEGRASEGASARELDDLRARVVDLESQVARVPELEERVDFTERLLARQHDAPRLASGRPGEDP